MSVILDKNSDGVIIKILLALPTKKITNTHMALTKRLAREAAIQSNQRCPWFQFSSRLLALPLFVFLWVYFE